MTEGWGGHALGHEDRRHVERPAQGLGGRDLACKRMIKIRWLPARALDRHVVDRRFGVQPPGLERRRVNERLEGRPRAAQRRHAVDLSLHGVARIGRADERHDGRIGDVDHDDGLLASVGQPRAVLVGQALDLGLDVEVDGRSAAVGPLLERQPRGVRGRRRARCRREEDRVGPGVALLVGGDEAGGGHAGQDDLLADEGAGQVPVGPQTAGRLGQAGHERRLGQGEVPGVFAEIGQRRRLHAAQVAAVRRGVEVERQDIVLALQAFELHGAERLDQLGPEGARPVVHHATDLHIKRARARDDAAGQEVARGCPHDRHGVDAGMRVEAAVLGGHGGLGEPRRYLP